MVSIERGSGIVQMILFIPTLLILLLNYKNEKNSKNFTMYFVLGIMTFFSASLGYTFPVAGRTVYYFYSFFILYVSSIPLKSDQVSLKNKYISVRGLSYILLFCYLIMQICLMFFIGGAAKSNGIEVYQLFWK